MTCIVGMIEDGRVMMGADSAAVSGLDLTSREDPKLFALETSAGRVVIGFTDSYRMGQLLRYQFEVPSFADISTDAPPEALFRYMVKDFVEAARRVLKAHGYAEKEKERESAGSFLVGIRNRLFHICGDYQVEEAWTPYNAIGCGFAYALGCLHGFHATMRPDAFSTEQLITMALQAAEHFSAGVRGPFYTLTT